MASARSENPLTRAFWLGSVDPRPLAIFRIGLGLAILHDLVDYTRDLRAFFADDGMLPRGIMHDWLAWGVFDWVGTMPGIAVVYAAGCLAVLAFTLGFHTRWATVASWFFLNSLHHRNPYVIDGGDDLVCILLFWGIFCDLGARYSLDARRAKSVPTDVFAFGPRILQAEIAVLYFVAAILKLRLGWARGEAIYLALQLDGFVRPPGGWLGQSVFLCRWATRSVLAMEMAFPFLAFAPVRPKLTRALAIACGAGVQLGILFTMRVGIFTEIMLVVLALWLQPEWVDWLERSSSGQTSAPAPASSSEWRPPSTGRLLLCGVLALQFIVAIWDPFLGRRVPLPKVVRDERVFLTIIQPYGLFDVVYAIPRWDAPGVLSDGSQVEVLTAVAPGVKPRQPAYQFSRWNKFTFKGLELPFHYPELAAYYCRAYNERASSVGAASLVSFTLVNDATPPHDEKGIAAPPEHIELWHQTCSGI